MQNLITAKSFGELVGLNSTDLFVLQKKYNTTLKSEIDWSEELCKDFTFTRNLNVIEESTQSIQTKVEELPIEEDAVKIESKVEAEFKDKSNKNFKK